MAATATIIAAIGLGMSAVGTAVQMSNARSAQKQSQSQFEQSNALRRESEGKSKQLADLQTMRAKRAAAREAQIKRADVLSTAEARGASGSTPVAGATGSMVTQTGHNISFLDTANTLHSQASSLFGQAQEVSNQPIFGDVWGAGLSSFGGSLFKAAPALENIFGGGTPNFTSVVSGNNWVNAH